MKLALFQKDADIRPGLITERGIVDIADAVSIRATPQLTMTGIIDDHMRNIPNHWHAHARPKGGFFGRKKS